MPVKYDRELVQTTISAMERITEVKARREKAFYAARMAKAAPVETKARAVEVVKNGHVLGHKRTETFEKALAAAERKLASLEEEKAAKKGTRKAARAVDETMDLDAEALLDEESEPEQEKAVERMKEPVKSRGEKMKVKIKAEKKGKVRSSLVAGGGRGMDLD